MIQAQETISGTSFTDAKGTVWRILLDDAAIQRVRDGEQLDLLDLWSAPNAPQRLCEVKTFLFVLSLVCLDQYEREKMRMGEFLKRISPTIIDAIHAFLQEYEALIINNFPSLAVGGAFKQIAKIARGEVPAGMASTIIN